MQPLPAFRNPRPRILRSATELFARRSAATVSINDIATDARVSKASLYKEFPTKDALVDVVVAARSDDVHRRITETAERHQPGRDRIRAMCTDLERWYDSAGFAGCLVVNTAMGRRDSASTQHIARDHVERYHAFLTTELGEAGIGEPEVLARTIVTLIEGATVLHALGSTAAPDLAATVDDLIDRMPAGG